MTEAIQQFLRKANLMVIQGEKALDLSDMRFRFDVQGADTQSPNNASIRVFNLSDDTVKKVKEEYTRVVLQAGYESSFGVIFDGTIKQTRVGRESATDTFLDILAADGDLGYNFGIVNKTWAAGSTPDQHIETAAEAMGLPVSYMPDLTGTNPRSLPRGKVGFGMARDLMGTAARSLGSSWSIQGDSIQVIPFDSYLPSEALEINALTGMVGIPEQTEEGIRVRKLLDPKLRIGTLAKLNNKDIIQLAQQDKNSPIPFNQWTGIQYAAKIADGADGLYRIYVIEHRGDTRGNEWWSDLVLLTVNPTNKQVEAKD